MHSFWLMEYFVVLGHECNVRFGVGRSIGTFHCGTQISSWFDQRRHSTGSIQIGLRESQPAEIHFAGMSSFQLVSLCIHEISRQLRCWSDIWSNNLKNKCTHCMLHLDRFLNSIHTFNYKDLLSITWMPCRWWFNNQCNFKLLIYQNIEHEMILLSSTRKS